MQLPLINVASIWIIETVCKAVVVKFRRAARPIDEISPSARSNRKLSIGVANHEEI